jgi:hypothetical protein
MTCALVHTLKSERELVEYEPKQTDRRVPQTQLYKVNINNCAVKFVSTVVGIAIEVISLDICLYMVWSIKLTENRQRKKRAKFRRLTVSPFQRNTYHARTFV